MDFVINSLLHESEISKNLEFSEDEKPEAYETLLSEFTEDEKDLIVKFYKDEDEREYSFSVDELLSLLHIFDYLGCDAAYEIALFLFYFENDENKNKIKENIYMQNYDRDIDKRRRYRHKILYFVEKGMIFPIKWFIKHDLFNVVSLNDYESESDGNDITKEELYRALSLCKNLKMFEFMYDNNYFNSEDINSILEFSSRTINEDVIDYLFSINNGIDIAKLFIRLCANGKYSTVKWIINKGFNVDINKGFTRSCESNNMELIKYFLDNFQIDNKFKIGAFYLACEFNKIENAKFLYELIKDFILENEEIQDVFRNVLSQGYVDLAVWYADKFNIDINTIIEICEYESMEDVISRFQ